MKQLLIDARSGATQVADVPAPLAAPGTVLVQNRASLVSAGTERAALEFAEKNLLQKARSRPDLVKQVLNKVRRDGLRAAFGAVQSRLDVPQSLGYSSAGVVLATGDGVTGFEPGDYVACAGAKYAVHAEVIVVPAMLTAKIPRQGERAVEFEEAAFGTVGAIAMHGVRLSEAKLGEFVAVIGLGLLGQLAVQMLKAAGCTVVGMDPNSARCELGKRLGCDATVADASALRQFVEANGEGADAVVITAATDSNAPVELAGEIARDRAIVVATGAVGTQLPRRTYYEKELDFRISRSYGPGRYDRSYEEQGTDYPIGYVRWTESRNIAAFLRLIADGKINVKPLITHRYEIEQAEQAYALITAGKEPFLGIVISYPGRPAATTLELHTAPMRKKDNVRVGMLGAGSFARSVLLPAIKAAPGTTLVGVCTASGASARSVAEKFGFRFCSTDESELTRHADINTVAIATRHDTHARQVLAGLSAGKNVFCEKPLAVNEDEIAQIAGWFREHANASSPLLMVGYNRRFAPLSVQLRDFFAGVNEPLLMNYRVNAGEIPANHWLRDPEQRGRIIGEACHFVDLLMFVTGSMPVEVHANGLSAGSRYADDNVVATLRFENGSIGTISYVANGDKSFSKERLEVIGGGKIGVLEDFRSLTLTHEGRRQNVGSKLGQDKGHAAEWVAFSEAVRNGGPWPIPLEQLLLCSLATCRIVDARHTGASLRVDLEDLIKNSGTTSAALGHAAETE